MRSLATALSLLFLAGSAAGHTQHGFDYNDPAVKWFESKMVPWSKDMSCCGKGDAYAVDEYEKQADGSYKVWITEENGEPIKFPDGTERPGIPAGEYIVPRGSVNQEDDDLDNPQGHSVLWATVYEGKITRVWCFVRHPNGI